ncbi:MAG TPA: PilN domain-containing protein [Patescibacteria group bacterium]
MIKLNLIPPAKKEEMKKTELLSQIFKWETELVGIFIVFIAMLASTSFILKVTASSEKPVILSDNNEQYKEIEKYDIESKDMSKTISQIDRIQKGQLNWYKFFEKINNQFSDAIEMKKIETSDYSVLFTGKAKNRDSLVAFKENMEKEDCFSDVNLPLSNLVAQTDVEFQIDFSIKKECLH